MRTFLILLLAMAAQGPCLFADIVFSGSAVTDPKDFAGDLLGGGNLVLLVVDRSGSGFAADLDLGLAAGDDLSTFVGDPDDVVIASNASLQLGALHALPGTASFSLGGGIDPGDPFGIVFFDNLPSGSTSVTTGTHYGFATHPTWVIPGDGANLDYLSAPPVGQLQQLPGAQTLYSVALVPEAQGAALLASLLALFAMTRHRRSLAGC